MIKVFFIILNSVIIGSSAWQIAKEDNPLFLTAGY
jgi:hypothetical protein